MITAEEEVRFVKLRAMSARTPTPRGDRGRRSSAAPRRPGGARPSRQPRARAHGAGVCAVLFYGSCLRDGYRDGLLVDLYLLVDDYARGAPLAG